MKIVDVAEFYSAQGGGVQTYINHKLEASARLGCRTVIVAPGTEDRREDVAGGTIVWVRSPRIPFDRRYHLFHRSSAIHQILDEERPDLVEGSSPWLGGWAVAKWRGPAARSFFVHQDPVASYPQLLLGRRFGAARVDRLFAWFWSYMKSLSGQYDTTVVSGEWLADRFEGLGLRRPRAIPLGIDKSAFSPRMRDPELRRAMLAACGVSDPDTPLLISLSRHHPEKRMGTLIDAFEQASRERPMAYFLAGDGPLRWWVERKAAKVPGIFVAGRLDDRAALARHLASADALLHGCGFETYGLAVAEALCSGLPLVVAGTGGAAELATHGCAEMYEAGDAPGCAAAIGRLLDRDGRELKEATARAAQLVAPTEAHFESLFAFYARTASEHAWRLRQRNRTGAWRVGMPEKLPAAG